MLDKSQGIDKSSGTTFHDQVQNDVSLVGKTRKIAFENNSLHIFLSSRYLVHFLLLIPYLKCHLVHLRFVFLP